MTLVISKGITLRNQLPADAEADAYIAAVEAADGQALEPSVKFAIKNFVLCCKADGIWSAIKASCILAGARTLSGALVPLVGTAPTNLNFVSGDYNRKTGLGDSSNTSKYLLTNRNNNLEPQNSRHMAAFRTVSETRDASRFIMATANDTGMGQLATTTTLRIWRSAGGAVQSTESTAIPGLWAHNRSTSSQIVYRYNSTSLTASAASQTPLNENIQVFARSGASFSNARLAFYSIGESLDLALLDTRVTDLINAFGAAIP